MWYTAQDSSDNIPSYSTDSHRWIGVVYGGYRAYSLLKATEVATQHWACSWISRVHMFYYQFLHASAMLKHVIAIGWTSVHPSVCLSVCLSHAGIVSKPCFLRHTIAHSFKFCVYQDLREIPTGSPPTGPLNRGGGLKMSQFSTNNSIYLRNDWR